MVIVGAIAASSRQDALIEGGLWLAGIVALVGLGLLLGTYVFRRQRQHAHSDGFAMNMDLLRRMREKGAVSAQEYESIRTVLIRATRDV